VKEQKSKKVRGYRDDTQTLDKIRVLWYLYGGKERTFTRMERSNIKGDLEKSDGQNI
jgi:hypothetical protein